MGSLNIDALSVPPPVKTALHTLSAHIQFEKAADKGSNGYLVFGHNTLLDRKVAVKFCYWGGDKAYLAEPKNLAAIESPNIVTIFDAALLDQDYVYFITPYYESGDLDGIILGELPGNAGAVDIACGILSGLTCLHAERYLHRDLKPENVFVGDDGSPLIGDFGSVKTVPEGSDTIPGSGHSLIYTPPESVESQEYSFAGDIYQVGVAFYQLLGGYLPYEETAWLSEEELQEYGELKSYVDRSVFATNAIKNRIVSGTVVNVRSLPPWVCTPLRRAVSKACHLDPARRFQSANAFLAHLHKLKPAIRPWLVADGYPTLPGGTSYRLCRETNEDVYRVEKRKTSGWRRDNSFEHDDLRSVVKAVEETAGV